MIDSNVVVDPRNFEFLPKVLRSREENANAGQMVENTLATCDLRTVALRIILEHSHSRWKGEECRTRSVQLKFWLQQEWHAVADHLC